MTGSTAHTRVQQDPVIMDGYTYIYNRILSALADDNVSDEQVRIGFAKQITDAIWQVHLSVNKTWSTKKYNNFANTKSMVSSIISDISIVEEEQGE